MLASLGAVVVLVAGIGGYALYQQLVGNINYVKVGGLTHRALYGVQNILVLGSQTRQGQHGHFGQRFTPGYVSNSDNLLLVHLDVTHTHATVLSIPRDTMVYEPACRARVPQIGTGILGPYSSTIIDGALNIGGPTCAVRTVEDLTGIKLDHFVEFNFNSFRTMVDALGGVPVCVPKTGLHDPATGINLSPGVHKVTYNQALAYVRTRHVLGGPGAGGDLPRIKLQQAFISSVLQQVNSTGLLTNSLSLYHIASIATKALTIDQGMGSISSLLHFARSLVGLRPKNVSLVTMPTITDPADQNRLLPQQPQDDVLFQMILDGTRLHGNHLPLTPTHQIQVKVLNGAGVTGLAAQTAKALRALGFDVISRATTAPTSATTITYSGTAQADAAYTLGYSLHAFPAEQNTLVEPASLTGVPGPITLTLGSDYANFAVNAPPAHHAGKKTGTGGGVTTAGTNQSAAAASSPGPGTLQARNAGANICQGLPLATN
jgi:LCP family protein required for cell wall assembly